MNHTTEEKRIESKEEIQTYLDRLKYAIRSGSVRINFQIDRKADYGRDKKYTNRYTMNHLFPDEDPVEVLKRELSRLIVEDYIETVKDIRFPKRSEMRVFGKQYSEEYVYIKIRVELVSLEQASGRSFIFVMSFHYSERELKDRNFPYKKV
ncbi:MAG TPA: hypothetical protein PK566_06675 [Pseudobacteroides sp.]|jgi:hypothetical protein|nr:hypothetical protein [Pseudobacteroides sp.]